MQEIKGTETNLFSAKSLICNPTQNKNNQITLNLLFNATLDQTLRYSGCCFSQFRLPYDSNIAQIFLLQDMSEYFVIYQ